jgi:hypothetical protein
MKRTLVTFAVAFLFLAALPLAAQTGTWTAVGSTGVMDESAAGIFQFGTTNLTYNGAGSLNPIIARYNVTNTFGGAASDTPPWQFLEMGYLDTNPQVAVQATLFRVDPCTGAQIPLCTVVSSDAATSVCKRCQFTAGVNFATNLYYVQVVLTRQTAGVTPPQLFTLRIF